MWINLSDHHQKCFDFEDALAAGERAAALAEKLDDKGRLVVALETMAQVCLHYRKLQLFLRTGKCVDWSMYIS